MKKIGQVNFHNWDCDVLLGQYENNRKAIVLVDSFNREPVAKVSVNIPEINLEENEVIIKNYSENEGILEILTEAGIIEPLNKQVCSGWVTMEVCKILI